MGRSPVATLMVQIFGIPGPFSEPRALPDPQIGALQRPKSTVETKFDLPWLCLSGLGSLRYFSGFWRGQFDQTRLRRANRAQATDLRETWCGPRSGP